ncbi:MAG: HDIG domain-containing protein [Candidatus Aenigmarchaeota archaeon]|nr:HDIG domain-containing protein [Candidatus Aenigmarchaeota archaeon]
MERTEAKKLLAENVSNRNIRSHSVAVAAIMEGLAEKLGGDKDTWWLTGILHDLDYEKTSTRIEKHGLETAELLEGKVAEEIIYAIKAHNGVHTGIGAKSNMDIALIASDALSGLIISTALIMPSKKLSEVTVESVMKKFKKKDFAKAVSREKIMTCQRLNLSQEEFLGIGLAALCKVSEEMGL